MAVRDNKRLMYLFDRLDRIQFATKAEELETAMHEFTRELLQLKVQPQNSIMNQNWNPQVATQNDQGSIIAQVDETILVSYEQSMISSIPFL